MFSRLITAATVLSLGLLASAQTSWPGQTFAIQGVVNDTRPWVFATGSPLDAGISYNTKIDGDTSFYEWFIQSDRNATDPSTQVNILGNSGFAEPYGGHPLVCGGQGMLLRTTFTAFPTVWDLTPLGNDQYKISTNVTTPNSGGKPSRLFWSIHRNTQLLPLDPEGRTDCTDSGGIAQVFQLLPPSALH